jgi:hypothetical protein
VNEKRPDSSFDDVSTQHRDDRTPAVSRIRDRRDDGAEVARDEHVGQRAKEVTKRQIAVERSLREFVG